MPPTAPVPDAPREGRVTQGSPRPQAQHHRVRTAASWVGHHRTVLLIAFAFTVMADPVSSVAYAIEAALRALGGDLSLLIATMGVVVGIIALVVANYYELVARFPQGGGAAAASGAAFGEGVAFLPLGALVVDFVLTISVSVAAGTSAIVAYFPAAHTVRVPLALGLLLVVAALTWFGHWGRILFAVFTLSFVGIGVALLISGFAKPAVAVAASGGHASAFGAFSVMLAFPVGMALATGVEAPSSAIAQLGQLDDAGRRHFGRVTLVLTLLIVGGLTMGITTLAVRLGVGVPPANSTQIGDVARAAGSRSLFALFQVASAVLLLAAASSSFQAGPGLLKALARVDRLDGTHVGILPSWLGRTNRHHTPYWAGLVYLVVSAAVIVAAGARDQELVLFYAVAVFISFLAGLLAMLKFSHVEKRRGLLLLNAAGTIAVGFTLAVNLLRGYPLVSLGAALLIAGVFYWLWVRAGRPRGVSQIEKLVEQQVGEEQDEGCEMPGGGLSGGVPSG
jgi:amino acid transporter